jgi:hypothetical protein
MTTAADTLRAAATTYAERNAIYGDNWYKIGAVMNGLFPEGIHLKSIDDHVRFYYLMSIAQKLTRYSNNFHHGGHRDSIHDACVYAAMLETFDYEFTK